MICLPAENDLIKLLAVSDDMNYISVADLGFVAGGGRREFQGSAKFTN